MTGQSISVDLALSELPEGALTFAEAIATGCRAEAPALFDALARTLAQERDRRADGGYRLVLFTMPGATIAEAYDGAKVALAHSVLCGAHADRAAAEEPEHVAGWRELAGMFMKIHFAILAADSPALLAFHRQLSVPPNAA